MQPSTASKLFASARRAFIKAGIRRSTFQAIRLWQVRRSATLLTHATRLPLGLAAVKLMRRWSVTRAGMDSLVGYRRIFMSLADAGESAWRYIPVTHASIDNVRVHMALAEKARASDYPVLFHLAPVLPNFRTVFDFGGNVGNLLYCYQKYLPVPLHLTWTVYDLPEIARIGAELARSKGEVRIRFTDNIHEADGVDLFLASGSLHYFEVPLPELLGNLRSKPRHIIINRTPLTDAASVITVQDAGTYLAPCKLYNKQQLIADLRAIGYDLVDSWTVHELSVHIPCYPELSAPTYTGLYLKLGA